MKEWDKIKTELGLYQRDPNSMWYTDDPIFCGYTKKQVYRGYIIATPDEFIGICDAAHFLENEIYKLHAKHEFIYLAGVESSAQPVKRTRRKERSKMNDSLRYKILKRDKFKCKSCGAKAGDVELEVDHITPISKGGRTIECNLQALCKKCNRGKSDAH